MVKVYNAVRLIVFTVITFIATVLLVIETPATGGYFNLGEASIYVIASIAPPMVTAVAAGLGPALADLVLGYWYFAPATFVIKFCEGYIVSYLLKKLGKPRVATFVRILTVVIGLILSAVVLYNMFGYGEEEAGVLFTWTETSLLGVKMFIPSFAVLLPSYIWLAISALIAILSIVVAFVKKPYVLAMAVGGMVMVLGYFLYEFFVSNPLILGRDPIGAIFEVPVNVGQFTAGILLSIPVVQFIERATKS
ncbi:MAG: ECF transporter S component [Ignisphaera sp.]|uniref:ECF transporter S component n=1 Tax=Ignisphaera aggregans TaxID=334771 RepID=A0A7C4NNL8_9CREN